MKILSILLFLSIVVFSKTESPYDAVIPNLSSKKNKTIRLHHNPVDETSSFKITPEFQKMNDYSEDQKERVKSIDPTTLPIYQNQKITSHDIKPQNGPVPRTEIIVDSSGSMGQLLNSDKTKMFYLKKMLTRFYSEQWKELNLNSLRVYGSRKRNDCDDTFQSIKPGMKSLTEIEASVKKLLPVGRTPIYKTIKQSIDSLKTYKGPKRIVIFTDGEETCGGDPCKLTKETSLATAMDIKFFVVAIGFPPGKDSLKKVKCLGEPFLANNENDLFNAFGQIQNDHIDGGSNNLQVISPEPTARTQLYSILPNGKLELVKVFTSSLGTSVSPGDYEAVVMLDPPFRFPRFTIPPKKKVTLHVVGLGKSFVKFHDELLTVELLDKNGKAVSTFTSDRLSDVPTGRFKLRAFRDPFFSKLIEPVVVTPEGALEKEITDAGAVIFEHPSIEGFYIYSSNEKLLGNFLTNYPVVLPRGSYRFHLSNSCSFDNVRVDYTGKIEKVSCSSMKNDRITKVLTERKLTFEDYIEVLNNRIKAKEARMQDSSLPALEDDILLEGTSEQEMIDLLNQSIQNQKVNKKN